MSALPTRVKVGPAVFRITWDEGEDWHEAERADAASAKPKTGSYLYGYTHNMRHCISIRPGLSEGAQRETLAHELFHLFDKVSGETLSMHAGDEEADLGEVAACAFSTPFLQFLQDNPAVVAYLSAKPR